MTTPPIGRDPRELREPREGGLGIGVPSKRIERPIREFRTPLLYTKMPSIQTARDKARAFQENFTAESAANLYTPPDPLTPFITPEETKKGGFWDRVEFVADKLGAPGEIVAGTLQALDPGGGEGATTARAELAELFKGEQGFRQYVNDIRENQRQRGFVSRFASEMLFDPLNLLPFGLVTKPGKALVGALRIGRGVKAVPGLKNTSKVIDEAQDVMEEGIKKYVNKHLIELPNPTDLVKQIRARMPVGSGRITNNIANWKLGEMAMSVFGVNVFDVKNPVHIAKHADAIMREMAEDSISGMVRRLRVPELKKLFDMDDRGMALIGPVIRGKRTRKAFQEIAQEADPNTVAGRKLRKILTDEQNEVLDNIIDAIKETERWLIRIGADPDDIIGKAKGRYFPNIWKYMGEMELMTPNRMAGKRVSKTASDAADKSVGLRSRYYEDAAEAIKAGLRGDPAEAIELLFKSQFRRATDKHLTSIFNTRKSKIGRYFRPAQETYLLGRKTSLDLLRTNFSDKQMKKVSDILSSESFKIPTDTTRLGKEIPELGFMNVDANWKDAVFGDFMKDIWDIAQMPTAKGRAFMLKELKGKMTGQVRLLKEEVAEARKASDLYNALKRVAKHGGDKQFALTDAQMFGRKMEDLIMDGNPDVVISNLKNFNKQLAKELQSVIRPEVNSILKATSSMSAMTRALRTGMDIGVMAIHGLPILFLNPGVWMKATKMSMRAMTDKSVMGKFLDNHWETYKALLRTNHVHGAGSDFVEALRQGGFISKAAGALEATSRAEIRAVGKGIKVTMGAFEEQFNSWLLTSKILMHEALAPLAEDAAKLAAKGSARYNEIMYDFNDMIAKMTGTVSMANIGISPTGQQVLSSFLMFAPRYRMAVMSLISKAFYPGKGGISNTLARKTITNMAAGGVAMYMAIARAANQTPNLDPSKGNFLTLKIGDSNVGFGSAYLSLARFGANAGSKLFSVDDAKDLVKLNESDNVFVRFVRGQSSPITSGTWDMLSGRSFMGDPVHGSFPALGSWAGNQLLPFWASAIYDSPRKGWVHTPVNMLSEAAGLRSYPMSFYEEAMDSADMASEEMYATSYDKLSQLQKKNVLAKHPDIRQLMDENNEVWAGRGQEYAEWKKELREYDEGDGGYDDRMEMAIESFKTGKLDSTMFRKYIQKLNFARRMNRANVQRKYPEVMERLKELKEEPPEDDAYLRDIALNQYYTEILGGEFRDPETDQFLFDDYEEALQDFRSQWPDSTWHYIQMVTETGQDPIIREFYKGREALQGYWRIGDAILERTDNLHRMDEWKKYQRMLRYDKDEYVELHPWIKDLERATSKAQRKIRERNPEIDAWLFRWGYRPNVSHPLNQALDEHTLRTNPVLLTYKRALTPVAPTPIQPSTAQNLLGPLYPLG